jgi:DNA-binding transcriptional MerR regulator
MQEIPNKLYFRIGEVSDLVGVRPYVLRYWESEFPDIKPTKSKSGQRLYKRRDVEQLMRIRQLLYEERFTIDGARKRLKEITRVDLPRAAETRTVSDSRQLSVFEEHEIEPRDEIQRRGGPSSMGDKKVFAKIKKDLEQLLAMVKE